MQANVEEKLQIYFKTKNEEMQKNDFHNDIN